MKNTTPTPTNAPAAPPTPTSSPTRIISNSYIRLLTIIIISAVLIGILSTYYYYFFDSSYSIMININAKDDRNRIVQQVVSNKAIKIVVMVHTAKKYYTTRIIAIRDTWLSKVPGRL